MGNCWPKPIQNIPSNLRLSTPINSKEHGNKTPAKSPRSPTASSPARNGEGANKMREEDGGEVAAATAASGKIVTPSLKMFTLAELKSATRNFRPDIVLGEGGFGRVFKGWVDEKTLAPSKVGVGMAVAVKKSSPDSEQGIREWQAEVNFLGKFCHPNLVKLIGYCWEEKEFLLVYEHMQRGSLESHLFRRGGETLPWELRLKIALGAARGLAFLHTTEKQVIYRDFKAANILLDVDYNAKLSDFGLAKLGPAEGATHVTTRVVGTYGYAAPEYMATGHLYVRSDVYGFGVVLLEIITGLRVMDLNRPGGQHNLVDWAKPILQEKKKLRKIIDPRLEGQYPSKAVFQISELIMKCLEPDPKVRPHMEEVLVILEEINAIKMRSRDQKPNQTASHRHSRNHNGGVHRSPLHPKKTTSGNTIGRQECHFPTSNRSY